jgi:glycosyltransferase involved in cell wall biosynthesis
VRVLAIYRHYWPDTAPYSRILREVLEHLAADGHSATVFTSQPSYNDTQNSPQPKHEQLNDVSVIRVALLSEKKSQRVRRALNFAYFLLRAVAHAVINRRRYEVVLANTHPPVLMGLTLRVIRWLTGCRTIYHIQDMHPECAIIGGELQPGRLAKQLRAIDAKNCARADQLVVLSQDMLKSLNERGVSTSRATVLNNPPQTVASANFDASSLLPTREGKAQFLFAGNLGRFQGLDKLVAAMHCLGEQSPVCLIFMGEGAAKQSLVKQAGQLLNRTIFFVPNQSPEVAQAAMQAVDYGIVSLLPNVYRYAFPSKFMTYLAVGCPVFAIVESDSELATTLGQYEMGYVARERNPDSIAVSLHEACAQKEQWSRPKRQELIDVCERLYGKARMKREWSKIMLELASAENSKSLMAESRAA